MVDLSADVNGEPFIHWGVAGIDALETSIVEGTVPAGAVEGVNFFGAVGWSGPCPPAGDDPHEYQLTVYALNQPLDAAEEVPTQELLDAIEGSALTSVSVTGTYVR
jgi:Raf kinase inhibitor-like YbhB/YbcL family protein